LAAATVAKRFPENYCASLKWMRRGSAAGDTLAGLRTSGDEPSGDGMGEILRFFPATLARLSVDDPFLGVAIFSGAGLLASLLVLIVEQYLFGTVAYP
jgi:hypothetical protein